ncbi:serine hydrolase domain-containing protein [Nonomuraea indica]|uniref:serine hydrolase domain-containing protein n=1 Tax=Nonomuraea indica TaxID=1581193 RepID=UPI000C7B8AFA|nr:serine hydrolase domain-containing protein [Nonomuraea indica]
MKRARTLAAGLALAALAGTAAAGPALAATPAYAMTHTMARPVTAELPPVNAAALERSIADLPAADATAAEVRVGGSRGSWRGVAGVTDLRTRKPAREGARFRAGSVTKMFTTAVVLQLVAEGRLSLDDTVQSRLPGLLPGDYPDIAVGRLLNHTSGLPSPDVPGDLKSVYDTRFRTWTPHEYVALAVRNPIEFAPGTRQHYVNINTFVAGLLIEKVTGRTYEHEVTTRILRPVGMRDSYLAGDSVRVRGRHNRGYQVVPEGFRDAFRYGDAQVVDMTEMSSTSTWASGDLVSTTADLEKFVRALFSGKVVPPAQLEPMFTVPPVKTYGSDKPATYTSGMSRMVLPNGVVGYGKTGARYGFSAGVGATRDLSRTLVYAVNSTDSKAQGQNQRTLGVTLAAFTE